MTDGRSVSLLKIGLAENAYDRATAAAGIPLIRWQASALPDETAIRQALVPHQQAHFSRDLTA